MAIALEDYVMAQEALTVAAVARRLGVAPATLRTWDRRYGLGPSEHSVGEHRRYSETDLARLTLMRKLVIAGVTPAEAAQQALELKTIKGIKQREPVREFEVKEDLVGAIIRAAKSFDRAYVEQLLSTELKRSGVISTWSEVIVPMMIALGDEWESDGKGIEVEHLMSDVVSGVLRDAQLQIDSPVNPRPVILATVGEDLHSLALYALAAALSEQGIYSHVLGARTPLEALDATMRKSAPPAVFLWSSLSKQAKPQFVNEL
ncbi:MAG: MerR family transcriptional regulator, partial [Actinobacteria bacterium]|nr:MerR family transcriptional regulator [Actinomycetota bacterium]